MDSKQPELADSKTASAVARAATEPIDPPTESDGVSATDSATAGPSTTMSGALLIGKITEASGLWTGLEDVRHLPPIRNGVFIIFSKETRGRLGLFCNRYVTGAACHTSGKTGSEALYELFSVDSGLYGFRASLPGEEEELGQSLAIDIWELVAQSQSSQQLTRPSPAALIDSVRSGTHDQIIFSDDNFADEGSLFVGSMIEPTISKEDTHRYAIPGLHPGDVITTDYTDESFSLSQWLASDGTSAEGGKLRQILLSALPPLPDKDKPEAETHLGTYRRIVEMERAKVVRDIESSMNGQKNRALFHDIQLFADLIEEEEQRVSKWEGLDEIRTPTERRPADTLVSKSQDVQGFVKKSKEFKKVLEQEEVVVRQNRPQFEISRKKALIMSSCFGLLVTIFGVNYAIQNYDSNTALANGQKELTKKRYESAASFFDSALKADAGNGRAYLYRGIARAKSAQYPEALSDFDQATIRGYGMEAGVASADALCRSGEYSKAEKSLTTLLANNTGADLADLRAQAYLLLAVCKEQGKEIDAAERACSSGLDIVKDPALKKRLLQERALVRLDMKSWKTALEDIGDDTDEELAMLRGDARRFSNKFEEARKDYSTAIRHNPRNADAYIARGICEEKLHHPDEARKDFSRALAINKSSVEALIRRGAINLSAGAKTEAIADLAEARRLAPSEEEAEVLLAKALGKAAKPPVGLTKAALASVLSSDSSPAAPMPKDSETLFTDGVKLLQSGEPSNAVAYLSQAVRLKPNSSEARRYLAYALYGAGNMKEAAAQFKALSTLTALPEKDITVYSETLARAGSIDSAIDLLENLLKHSPRSLSARTALIKMYTAVNFPKHSKQICDEGLAVATTDTERQLLRAALEAGPDPEYKTTGSRRTHKNSANDLGG